MLEYLKFFLLFNNLIMIWADSDELNTKVITTRNFMFWPNATVPFYVNPDHFDQEQTIAIMTALSIFAFKTCLKFAPVMDNPKDNEHVMMFVNPDGIKRCKIETSGHSVYEPHTVLLGYECLQSPQIDMMIMKALGFPFEHNRLSRDLYIDVLIENIEPGAVELFTKDVSLPVELRGLAYDVNSVMHFGQRDHSKNGHRTILFKNPDIHQNRIGLSPTDLKKIQIVYGLECQKRDRQEKVELCQSYPAVVRRKRQADTPATLRSLRVNPNITPPPSIVEANIADSVPPDEISREQETRVSNLLKELGIEDEAQEVIDHVYKISSEALNIARKKYCNNTQVVNISFGKIERSGNADILGILSGITEYVTNMVEHAVSNLTIFCQNADSMDAYQRAKCNWRFDNRCHQVYRSTKSGAVRFSTNHRPYIFQSTKHRGQAASYSYDKVAWRAGNDTNATTPQTPARRKREAIEFKKSSVAKDKLQKEKKNIKEKIKLPKGNSTKDASSASINKRRFFETRRYKTKRRGNKSEVEWAGSYISEGFKDSLSQESKEIGTEVSSPAPDKEAIKELKKSAYIEKEVVPAAENVASEVEKDESETEVTTAKEKKPILKTKHKDKKRLRDTFELFEDKKKVKEDRFEKKAKKHHRNDIPVTIPLTKLNKEFYNERIWPEGIIRYTISPLKGYDLDDMRSRLGEVIRILKKKTCVKLEEVSEEDADNFEDYLVLDASPDYITGRVGGKQHFGCLELFKGGQHKQHAAMMVMAMLGFYFEVARHDRDKHIRVHMRHVRPDKLHHFEKIRDEATLNLSYDYRSATHPAWQFWRKIGKTGISTVATYKGQDPDGSVMRSLGQHDELLSESDLIKINSVYGTDCFQDLGAMRASNNQAKPKSKT